MSISAPMISVSPLMGCGTTRQEGVKLTVSKNEVLKAKSACQAAATTAHQAEPSGSRDGDFCKESSDENKVAEKAIK